MRLVAAAKVRRAQEAVLSTRPFNEGLQSVFSGLVKRLAIENIELPLLQVRFRALCWCCWPMFYLRL
jgi:F-type H+-transporting ATPase subunit gamma